MVKNAYDINPKIDRDEEFLSKLVNIKKNPKQRMTERQQWIKYIESTVTDSKFIMGSVSQ